MITVSKRSQEYVRRRVQDHMTATVTLYRYGTVDFDDDTGMSSVPSRQAIYTGKARIAQINAGPAIVVGETDITTATTSVSIPWSAPAPHKDDIVTVNHNPTDTSVVGKSFRVMNVDHGGLIGAARRMQCSTFIESAQWE